MITSVDVLNSRRDTAEMQNITFGDKAKEFSKECRTMNKDVFKRML